MAIDDPIKAAESVLAAEERELSPIGAQASRIAEFLPGPIAKALARVWKEDSARKFQYMVEVLKQECVYLQERLGPILFT
jgi:hypothetical protein